MFSVKKMFLEFPKIQRKTPVWDSLFYQFFYLNFIKIETLAQVFSCEFCEISKNTFFYRTPRVAASWSYIELYLELCGNSYSYGDGPILNLKLEKKVHKHAILQRENRDKYSQMPWTS